MTMADLVLYDAANSPCGRRVRMCLIEKHLDFEIRWLALGLMDQKQPWYLKLNPNGLVPTLVHGERAIYESNAINEYLDATFPESPLVPKDPYLQAQMRMWMAFELEWAKPFRDAIYETMGKKRLQDSGITPERLKEEITRRTGNAYYLKFATEVLTRPKNAELVGDRHQVLLEKMQLMEERLSDGRTWLVGDDFTLADIALAPRTEMFPRIGAFMERIRARPSWQKSAILPEQGEASRRIAA
jgi:glutathione S-transferase